MIVSLVAGLAALVGIYVNIFNSHRTGVKDEADKREKTATMETKIDHILADVQELKISTKQRDKDWIDHEVRISALEKKLEA